jgi:hypothetical protein
LFVGLKVDDANKKAAGGSLLSKNKINKKEERGRGRGRGRGKRE